MNSCRFLNFSSDASFPNNPMVGEIAVDPLQKKVFVYTDERWVEIVKPTPRPYVPVMRIHDAICPSCGALVPPSASRCGFCGRYFE